MKKLLLSIFTILSIVFVVSGCSGSSVSSADGYNITVVDNKIEDMPVKYKSKTL